jgi:hypothetical protein
MLRITVLARCRMTSEMMPAAAAQRSAAQELARTAEKHRLGHHGEEASAAVVGDAAAVRPATRKHGGITPANYIPRNANGEPYGFRVAAVLDAEARLRGLSHPVWYTAAEATSIGLKPAEMGIFVNLGQELTLRPLEAFGTADVKHLLNTFRLPTRKQGRDTVFTASFDGRPYDRPFYMCQRKWRQTNSNKINSELVEARVQRQLTRDLWLDSKDAQILGLELVKDAQSPEEAIRSRFGAITVNDGSTVQLFTKEMLDPIIP